MFKVRIVGKNDEKEARLSEEDLQGFVSKFVIMKKIVLFVSLLIANAIAITANAMSLL